MIPYFSFFLDCVKKLSVFYLVFLGLSLMREIIVNRKEELPLFTLVICFDPEKQYLLCLRKKTVLWMLTVLVGIVLYSVLLRPLILQ